MSVSFARRGTAVPSDLDKRVLFYFSPYLQGGARIFYRDPAVK